MFYEIGALKNFAKFANTCARVSLNKVTGLYPGTLLTKFCKIFKAPYFIYRKSPVTTSVIRKNILPVKW